MGGGDQASRRPSIWFTSLSLSVVVICACGLGWGGALTASPLVLTIDERAQGACGDSGCAGGSRAADDPAASSLMDVGIAVRAAEQDVADAREEAQEEGEEVHGLGMQGLQRYKASALVRGMGSRKTMLKMRTADRSSLHAQSKLPFGSDTFPLGVAERWPPLMTAEQHDHHAMASRQAAASDIEDDDDTSASEASRSQDTRITPAKIYADEMAVERAGWGGKIGVDAGARSGDAVFDTQVKATRDLARLSEATSDLSRALSAVRRQRLGRANRRGHRPGSSKAKALVDRQGVSKNLQASCWLPCPALARRLLGAWRQAAGVADARRGGSGRKRGFCGGSIMHD